MKPRRKTGFRRFLSELHIRNFLALTLAGMINAFGVTMFLYPVKIYDSGISGASMLLDQITPASFQLSMFLLLLNIPIFLFGLKKQGAAFTLYSIFTIGIYSLTSFLIMDVLPVDVDFVSPLAGQDLLLCAIFGGLISGIGSGITIRYGGAIDGIDVMSVIFAKKLGLSLGSFVMMFNTLLYVVCGLVIQSWILPLYSIVTYFVGSKTVDFITEGFNRAKCAMIVTTKAREISDSLAAMFKAGGTIVRATGGYSGRDKQIVYYIVNQFQIYKLREVVFQIDPHAFISLQDVSDIIKKTVEAEPSEMQKENPKMEQIASFTINHLNLLPGLYVSRIDRQGETSVTTFDLRITAPNREPVMDMPALHTLEHMGATFLRNCPRKEEILYFGPMGCRTGCYLLMFGERNAEDIYPLILELCDFILGYEGEIPGAAPEQCGNYSEQNLPMAKYYIRKYKEELTAHKRFVYPD